MTPAVLAKRDILAPFRRELEELRLTALSTKDFSKVDELKSALVGVGVEVRIGKEGVTLLAGPNFDPTKLEALQ